MELVETPVSPEIIVTSVSINQFLLQGVPLKELIFRVFFLGTPCTFTLDDRPED